MKEQKKKKLSKSYYFKTEKFIRDLVHGYINLTRFDLTLIDTVPFQRLSDIRQLTCQHVYPAARHTRFEHSLGVQELMRNAIKYLNRNGIIGEPPQPDSKRIISEALEFNACVAALLHDVGHCPFSHMGETEFDKKVVQQVLVNTVKGHPRLENCSDLIKKLEEGKGIGAVHEQLSCIVILNEYSKLLNLTQVFDDKQESDSCEIETDFELIIRSILGIEYDVSKEDEINDHKIKNIIVRLLNSKIIDVDKLDYIMRDSYLTGIGTPAIDTQRLFRNMYLDKNYFLIFTSKAVPALQNMIDARDGLYLYVYNHHAVVYSDFLNTYISRRLYHNAKAFYRAVYPDINEQELEDCLQQSPPVFSMGIVPKSYFFSVDAVEKRHYSDSAWLSLLNEIHISYQEILEAAGRQGDLEDSHGEVPPEVREEIKERLREEFKRLSLDCFTTTLAGGESKTHDPKELSEDAENALAERIHTSMQLIHQSMQRRYLKPWWKTVFELSNFMSHYFRDDRVREQIGEFICTGGVQEFVYKGEKQKLKADEFRSQIAKHVIYITKRLMENEEAGQVGLLEDLNDGDFFVIQRSPRFFAPDTIEKIEIALKNNEILGPPVGVSRQVHEYYIKKLTNIIPQKEYSSIYAEEGFYIFSKRLSDTSREETEKSRHYELLERIFAFVAEEFVDRGEFEFIKLFQDRTIANEEAVRQKSQSKDNMYKKFAEKFTSGSGQAKSADSGRGSTAAHESEGGADDAVKA